LKISKLGIGPADLNSFHNISYLASFKNNFTLYEIFGEGVLNGAEEFSKNSSPLRYLDLDSSDDCTDG
jgi:hypothetical protein